MTDTVSINSATKTGNVQITLTKIGVDHGTLVTKTKSKTDKFPLFNVRKISDNEITFYATVMGPDPLVHCHLDPVSSSITLTISGAWAGNGTTQYVLVPADFALIHAFIVDSKFPAA